MKQMAVYACEHCQYQTTSMNDCLAHEAEHYGLTPNEYQTWGELNELARQAGYAISVTKNEETERDFDKAIEILVKFETKYDLANRTKMRKQNAISTKPLKYWSNSRQNMTWRTEQNRDTLHEKEYSNMKQLSEITLGFENCEIAVVNADNIKRIYVHGVGRYLEYTSNALSRNVSDCLLCDSLHLVLKPGANTRYDSFGHESEELLFKRIAMFDDIVSITLTYEDGSEEEIYVPYEGEERNALQTTETDKHSHLVITITKGAETET